MKNAILNQVKKLKEKAQYGKMNTSVSRPIAINVYKVTFEYEQDKPEYAHFIIFQAVNLTQLQLFIDIKLKDYLAKSLCGKIYPSDVNHNYTIKHVGYIEDICFFDVLHVL